jgi:hypothetical protein
MTFLPQVVIRLSRYKEHSDYSVNFRSHTLRRRAR